MWIKLPSTVWINSDKIKEIYWDIVEEVAGRQSQRIYFILDDDGRQNISRFFCRNRTRILHTGTGDR